MLGRGDSQDLRWRITTADVYLRFNPRWAQLISDTFQLLQSHVLMLYTFIRAEDGRVNYPYQYRAGHGSLEPASEQAAMPR